MKQERFSEEQIVGILREAEQLKERQIRTHYIEPGSPWQNAYGESFNGKFRDECLNREKWCSQWGQIRTAWV